MLRFAGIGGGSRCLSSDEFVKSQASVKTSANKPDKAGLSPWWHLRMGLTITVALLSSSSPMPNSDKISKNSQDSRLRGLLTVHSLHRSISLVCNEDIRARPQKLIEYNQLYNYVRSWAWNLLNQWHGADKYLPEQVNFTQPSSEDCPQSRSILHHLMIVKVYLDSQRNGSICYGQQADIARIVLVTVVDSHFIIGLPVAVPTRRH